MNLLARSSSRYSLGRMLVMLGLAVNTASSLSFGAQHHLSTVPPTMEIEVLDPRADPLSRPAVELKTDCEGGMQVDIPRPVIVHKLYYSGNRNFQAQMLPGGPSVVVANHPRTGERCYIDVVFPPGAPRVYYTGHAIEYDFGDHGVTVTFGLIGSPKVVYRNGKPIVRTANKAAHSVATHTVHAVAKTGVPEYVGEVAQGATAVVCNTTLYAGGLGKHLLAPVVLVAKSTPIGSLVKRDPAKEAEHAQKLAARKRQHHSDRLEETIPTVR